MLRIDPIFFPFSAFLFLIIPLPWLFSALFAAVIHELFHIITIYSLGGTIYRIHIGIGKAVIDSRISSRSQEMLSAAAGPLGSLILIPLYPVFPRLALCGAVQGFFNLIPILPFDGGRVLYCILTYLCPESADQIFRFVEKLFLIFGVTTSIAAVILFDLWILPVLIFLLFLLQRKKPCKQEQIGIQ